MLQVSSMNTVSFQKVVAADPVEKAIKLAVHNKLIKGDTLIEQGRAALEKGIISDDEMRLLLVSEEAREEVIKVDDFAPDELKVTLSS